MIVAPTSGSSVVLLTVPEILEVVTWAIKANGIARRKTNKGVILLSIKIGLRLQRKGIFRN
jgi:hypothetical protein